MTADLRRITGGWEVMIDSTTVGTFRSLGSALAYVEHQVSLHREGRRGVARAGAA